MKNPKAVTNTNGQFGMSSCMLTSFISFEIVPVVLYDKKSKRPIKSYVQI
jgi:hypothetical protein